MNTHSTCFGGLRRRLLSRTALFALVTFSLGACASSTSPNSSNPDTSNSIKSNTVIGTWAEIDNYWMGRHAGDSTFKYGFTIDSDASGLSVVINQDKYVLSNQKEVVAEHAATPGRVVQGVNGELTINWNAFDYNSVIEVSHFSDSLGGTVFLNGPRLIYFKKD